MNEYVDFQLPSLGKLYDGKIPDGRVLVRRMTVGEDMILQSTASGLDLLSKLLAACVKLPNGFRADDLLVTDRFALLVALRVATFGPKYSLQYECRACASNHKVDVDLNMDLSPRSPKEGLVEPIQVQLWDAKKTVGLRFLRAKDEEIVSKAIMRARQTNQPDISLVVRMACQLIDVDGEVMEKQTDKEKFIFDLSMPDGQDWRDTIDDLEPGVDLTIKRECANCGAQNTIPLPMGPEFFRSTRRKPV